MPFTLIKGSFAPAFGRPDGDSLRFVPDDPSPIFRLRRRGRAPRINPNNDSLQLRYEGIDTLENRAAERWSSAATASNLELAGTDGGARQARGHILTNQLGPNGRPIAFVFAGERDEADGSEVFASADDIMSSLNVRQLERGLAYPLFYDTLFDDLRERLREVSLVARRESRGLWPEDRTQEEIRFDPDLAALPPIWPKLWRRIEAYVRDETLFDEERPFSNLPLFIRLQREERVAVGDSPSFTGLDDLVEASDATVRLRVDPHDLVIVSVS